MAWTALRNLAVLFAAATVLVACGGSGTTTSTSDSTDLAFAGGVGYNGSGVRISGGDATATTTSSNIVINYSQGTRTISVKVPVDTIKDGDSFAVGTSGGATVTYTETPTSGTTLTWVGTSGTVGIRSTGSSTTLVASLSGLTFAADSTVSGNTAAGTFLLEGQLGGIDLSASGGVGGGATITFSNNVGSNATLSDITSATVGYVTTGNMGTLTAVTGSGASARVLTVILYPGATAGTTVSLSGLVNSFSNVSYVEGDGSSAKTWVAKSGTLKVRSRTSTTAKIELTNAVFENPGVDSSNTATGNFTLTATVNRN